jgi:hypothetical protein
MNRTPPEADVATDRKSELRRRVARALVANYIHEVSGRHSAGSARRVSRPDAGLASRPGHAACPS